MNFSLVTTSLKTLFLKGATVAFTKARMRESGGNNTFLCKKLQKTNSSKQFGFRQSVFAPASPKGYAGQASYAGQGRQKLHKTHILRSYLVLGKAPKVERPEFTLRKRGPREPEGNTA